MSPSDVSWKLAEYERHFNVIQAGLRGIASIWMLAAFGAIASILTHDTSHELIVQSELAVAGIAAMGSTGLTVLWMQDQLIYHRLLNAIFLVGVRLESRNRDLPPIHAAMYASMPKKGYESELATFYNVPIGVLGVASLLTSAAGVAGVIEDSEWGWTVAAFAVTAVPFVLLFYVKAKSDDERNFFAVQARRYDDPVFSAHFPFEHSKNGLPARHPRMRRRFSERLAFVPGVDSSNRCVDHVLADCSSVDHILADYLTERSGGAPGRHNASDDVGGTRSARGASERN